MSTSSRPTYYTEPWYLLWYLCFCFGESERLDIQWTSEAADVVKYFGLNGWPTKLVSHSFFQGYIIIDFPGLLRCGKNVQPPVSVSVDSWRLYPDNKKVTYDFCSRCVTLVSENVTKTFKHWQLGFEQTSQRNVATVWKLVFRVAWVTYWNLDFN